MPDKLDFARRVFAEFIAEYERRDDPSVQWWLTFSEDDGVPGLASAEVDRGLGVLHQKGLIGRMGMEGWKLTEDGLEVCLHPELLDDYLGPRRSAALVQDVTIHAEQMHNTQVGHGNTMNVTYSQVLTSLAERIEQSPHVPAEKKHAWLATIRDIAKDTVALGTIFEAGKAVIDTILR